MSKVGERERERETSCLPLLRGLSRTFEYCLIFPTPIIVIFSFFVCVYVCVCRKDVQQIERRSLFN